MCGAGHADVLVILQVPGNKADAVPCERLPMVNCALSPDNRGGKQVRLWQQSMIFLARNDYVKRFMQSRATMTALSKKFVGGEDIPDVVEEAKRLKSRGIACSLFNLGEYIENAEIISQTVTELKSIVNHLAESQLDVHLSIDPTQVGYQIDARLCRKHAFDLANEIRSVTENRALNSKNFLMLDMEDSTITQSTIDLYKRLRTESYPAAITLQAYLYRTENDLSEVIRSGGAARLVKGAFAEDKPIAFTNRKEIDRNFVCLADMMLSEEARGTGFYPIFGTHDDRIIDKIVSIANSRKWKKDAYEFEMLYGVRRNYQKRLVHAGENLRLYLPFGTDWWPYAVRRVGENPKNAKFLFRSLIS
jgi:proline dehydrogenase